MCAYMRVRARACVKLGGKQLRVGEGEIGLQTNGWHCKTMAKSRCLLKFEALDTTIVGQGANQRRLGVIYLQIGWQTDGLHCKWTVNSRFLLQIEAWGEGENQLRLGVIYLQIGWQTSERMILQTRVKSKSGSIEDRRVGHNDRRRGWKSTTFGCHLLANWIKKKTNGLQCKTKVKSKCLCLLQIEALDTMIITIDDVQITLTIKRQCYWEVELIWCVACSVSANNNSALLCSFWPTYNTMIVTICYIDCTWCIDEETLG